MYYFHTQPSGLPEELSDNGGNLVWTAQYTTWGSTVSEQWQGFDTAGQPQQQQQDQTVSLQQNLRLQGQYLDRETGLHYNTFRHYDADLGAFTTPDPIGLNGGLNLHQYAPNPFSWIDPWGWKSKNCNGAAPEWKSRRTQNAGDSGLKDHARRHSDMSPRQYLEHGKKNITEGQVLRGGKYPDARYHVRKIGDNNYSVTITDKNGKILSIDTPKQGGAPLTQQKLLDWLKNSGVTPPKNF